MPVADAEVEVLIVGGGPVGLTARALLERWGVRTLLIEKHVELSPFPRSRLINVRSMEIFRQLGLAAEIQARAFAPRYGRIRFRDTLQGSDFATAGMVGVEAPIPESPVIGVVTSQDRLEPTLLAAADSELRFGVELVGLTEAADSVMAVLADRRTGNQARVRARYVLAADGANSTVRRLLDIGTTGPGALAAVTTVVFDADLRRWSADQPAGVYLTAHGTFLPLYPEGGWAWFGPTPEDRAHTDWSALVTHALGPHSDVKPEVLRVQHWVMNAAVAEHFQHGRILLAGDAAHAIPIMGGLGMNTGLADVHNLCWKLAGILQGWAGPTLLETYDSERHPVAQRTLHQAVANTQLSLQVQTNRRTQLQNTTSPPTPLELPWTDRYFAQLGLVLGVTYTSRAILTAPESAPTSPNPDGAAEQPATDAAAEQPGTDYLPIPEPGHRLPHLWLTPTHSTLDTLGEWFTLLTPDPTHWNHHPLPAWPLHVEPLTPTQATTLSLHSHEALLVRPDGHITARYPARPLDFRFRRIVR
ncbi:FAD-dependent monooxygenase [Nocardia sp. NPDC051030]|uniref:FAD-dependent monooxygenase n=1 Tax=Nocardia sp. NPDC051030 TaxID=3155162 RepID=UPI00342CB639